MLDSTSGTYYCSEPFTFTMYKNCQNAFAIDTSSGLFEGSSSPSYP